MESKNSVKRRWKLAAIFVLFVVATIAALMLIQKCVFFNTTGCVDDPPAMTLDVKDLPEDGTFNITGENKNITVKCVYDVACKWNNEDEDVLASEDTTDPNNELERFCDLYQWQCVEGRNKISGKEIPLSCHGNKRIFQGKFRMHRNMSVTCVHGQEHDDKCDENSMRYIAAVYAKKQKTAVEKEFHATVSYQKGSRFAVQEVNGRKIEVILDQRPEKKRQRERLLVETREQETKSKEGNSNPPMPGFVMNRAASRRRATTSETSLTGGGFNQAIKTLLVDGFIYKLGEPIPRTKVGGRSWLQPTAYYSAKELEVAVSTLPDFDIEAVKKSGTETEIIGSLDFSLGNTCKHVIKASVQTYLSAKACIKLWWWKWCYININSNGVVKVGMSPKFVVPLRLSVAFQSGKAGVSYKFGKSAVSMMDFDLNVPGVNIKAFQNMLAVNGLRIFGPIGGLIGWIKGFGMDRFLEHVVTSFKKQFISKLPEMANKAIQRIIDKKLSGMHGFLPGAPGVVALVALLNASPGDSLASRKLLALRLSDIPETIAGVTFVPQPKKIRCSGTGLIKTIDRRCITDYGTKYGDSALETYCYGGFERYCLTGEICPWRSHASERCGANYALASCSMGGLKSTKMAIQHGTSYNCRRHCRRRGWFRWCYNRCACSGKKQTLYCSSGSISN